MPTRAILITWRNMDARVLPAFIAKAQHKYAGNFHRLYFDDALNQPLRDLVASFPATDRLKIYISGHGGTGINYITDDTQTQKKTVDDLVDLLSDALMRRDTSRQTSAQCQINMISCLFGRTADGSATSTPAAKLHEGLADWDVFVDLVARTESIVATNEGRKTISLLNHEVYEPTYGRLPKFYQPKVAYSKVLHTFNGNARVVSFARYDGEDTYIEATSLDGRRLLWADYAVNQIVKTIHLKGTGLFGTGPKEVTDAREKVLEGIVVWYDAMRHPAGLKAKLESLVDGSGAPGNSLENFLKHRDVSSSLMSSAIPKKARLIQGLLAGWPV